jgi:WD40 repeat protein
MADEKMIRSLSLVACCCLLLLASAAPAVAQESNAIPIADIKHEGPVDFERELLPVLRRSCLACHNATVAEGELVLETPQTILKGGSSGPAVVAGNSAESLVLKAAAHQGDTVMPPEKNDKGARNLSSEELGLLKLWIDQGAAGQVLGAAGPVAWQPLPPGVNPIYAVAVSPDGQYVAAGRANQVFIYHAPSKREVGRLTDPSLVQQGPEAKLGVADLDLVQSLAFSNDNQFVASSGFRTAKLWRRPRDVRLAELAGVDSPPVSMAMSADGRWAACGQENGAIKVFDMAARQLKHTLAGHSAAVSGLAFSTDGGRLLSGSQDKTLRIWRLDDAAQIGQIETPAPVNAVAFVSQDQQLASGNADNQVRIYAIPADATPAAATPVKELGGHGGPVTSLAPIAAAGHLVTGCQDGAVRVYDVASGNVVRQMGHNAPVVFLAVRPDGKRIASAGGNIARLWNNENAQQIAELKGDFRAQIQVADITRAVELAKQKIETAKKDLEESNKRKTGEEENAKKAEEAKTKADQELTAKTEAAKKPVADKEEAEKLLAESKTALVAAEEAKKAAETELTRLTELLKKAQADAETANKLAAESAEAARIAAEKLVQTKDAAAKDTANTDLAAAAQEAEKASLEAEAKKKAAEEAKAAADKGLADADAAAKAQDAVKQQAEQTFNEAQNKSKEAENKVTQLTEPAQKAVDEKMSAERSQKAAERAVERAKEAVQKATAEVPKMEELVRQAEAATKEREAQLEQSRQAATATELALFSAAFSADNLTLAVGGEQNIYTFDAESGAPIDSFTGHGAQVVAVAFSPAGDVLGAAKNNTLILWDDMPQWRLERTIGNPDTPDTFVDRVTSLDFSNDGALLAAGSGEPSRSGQIKIFSVSDGSLVRELKEPHSDTVLALDFSPDNQHLASCGADRFMKVHSVAGGELVKSFEGHTHHVLGVAWRADGRALATGGADNVIKVWDFVTGDQLRTIAGFNKEVTAVRFIAITPQVAASCGDANVYVKNAENGGNVRSYGGASDYVHCVDVAPDGKLIVAGGQDSVLRLWRDDGQQVAAFAPPQ